jgi:hypothetical protein
MKIDLLHIYAQPYYHAESYIVGNRDALLLLRDAIDEALKDGKSSAEVSVADGEGYDTNVMLIEDEKTWDRLRRPYTDGYAKDTRRDALEPSNLWYGK